MSGGLTRRDFLQVAAAFGVATVGAGLSLAGRSSKRSKKAVTPAAPFMEGVRGRPNILLIMTDQERFDLPSPTGFSLPARERLRSQGVSFTRHHVTTAPCTPSRACIFTGQHVPRTHMFDNLVFPYAQDLSVESLTMGSMMRRAGYYAAYKGKWHLTRMKEKAENAQGLVNVLDAYGFSEFNRRGDFHGVAWTGFSHDPEIADDAVDWLRRRAPEVRGSQPWFLTVSFVNPHDMMYADNNRPGEQQQQATRFFPIKTPPEAEGYKRTWDVSLPRTLNDDLSRKPAAQLEYRKLMNGMFGEMPLERTDMFLSNLSYYCNCLQDVDRQVARVLDALEASGQARETVVIFTSDHGELGGAHGLRQKGPLIYRENVNVPLVICHPEGQKGATTQALSSAVDLAPTILSLGGVSLERRRAEFPQLVGHDLSGQTARPSGIGARAEQAGACLFTYDSLYSVDADFMKNLVTAAEEKRLPVSFPMTLRPNFEKRGLMRGMFDGRYKLNRYFAPVKYNRPKNIEDLLANNDVEVYDTQSDPDEMNNLAQDLAANRELIAGLNVRLEALINQEIGDDQTLHLPELPRLRPEPTEQ